MYVDDENGGGNDAKVSATDIKKRKSSTGSSKTPKMISTASLSPYEWNIHVCTSTAQVQHYISGLPNHIISQLQTHQLTHHRITSSSSSSSSATAVSQCDYIVCTASPIPTDQSSGIPHIYTPTHRRIVVTTGPYDINSLHFSVSYMHTLFTPPFPSTGTGSSSGVASLTNHNTKSHVEQSHSHHLLLSRPGIMMDVNHNKPADQYIIVPGLSYSPTQYAHQDNKAKLANDDDDDEGAQTMYDQHIYSLCTTRKDGMLCLFPPSRTQPHVNQLQRWNGREGRR